MSKSRRIPAEFARQFETERAHKLRRRALVYCWIVLGLVVFSLTATIWDLIAPYTGDPQADAVTALFFDTGYLLLYVAAIVLLRGGPVSRKRVVRIISWLVLLTGATTIISTPFTDNSYLIPTATKAPTDAAVMGQGLVNLIYLFIIHIVASMLVNLSPREGLRPLVPLLALFAVMTLVTPHASWSTRVTLIGLSPLVGVPGLLWSWWRHRSFFERFQARAIARRYEQVTRDLSDARRVHEALFPPPIRDGPVRLEYCYEPAQHIGGDFLFARRFPGEGDGDAAGSLVVVVLDVTGHGVPAALSVNRMHGELERLLETTAEPAAIVTALNRFTVQSLAQQRMYASAVCVRVLPPDAHGADVQWCSAGHPDALLRRRDGSIEPLRSTACMLGVLSGGEFTAALLTTRMNAGDVLALVTDGVHDSEDRHGQRIGPKGFETLLAAAPRISNRSLAEYIMRQLSDWQTGSAVDDRLIVALRLGAGA